MTAVDGPTIVSECISRAAGASTPGAAVTATPVHPPVPGLKIHTSPRAPPYPLPPYSNCGARCQTHKQGRRLDMCGPPFRMLTRCNTYTTQISDGWHAGTGECKSRLPSHTARHESFQMCYVHITQAHHAPGTARASSPWRVSGVQGVWWCWSCPPPAMSSCPCQAL